MATDPSDILMALMRSPLIYVLAFAAIAVIGFVYDVPILADVVEAIVSFGEILVPTIEGGGP